MISLLLRLSTDGCVTVNPIGPISRENFMRVDVFYRDLSYEVVEQRPAYDLTQLLSK